MASKLHRDWVTPETIVCNTEISEDEFFVVFWDCICEIKNLQAETEAKNLISNDIFSSHGFYFFMPVYKRLNKDENVSTQKHIANKQNLGLK